ncbi:3-phosphoshikimate 1-carboxyvinyltransferase, partial [bacterium]
NFLEGEDTLATFNAFRAMGVDIERRSGLSPILEIKGVGLNGLKEPNDVINCENSGTTARLLTGLLSAQSFFSVLTGDDSLRGRPMKRVVDPLRLMGADINGRKESTLLPLAISGGKLKGIEYSTPVASAQLKSSLLLAGLYAKGETIITEPAMSRDHTERMLKSFGADIEVKGNTVRIKPGKQLQAQRITVPCDISSAAFFMVGAMITPDSDILLRGVGVNPTRTGIIEILKQMGGLINTQIIGELTGEPVADIRVTTSKLKGIEIDENLLLPAIDEFPVICIAAAFADGVTTITGAKELRIKESDRIKEMAGVLKAIGIECKELANGIIITGNNGKAIQGGVTLDTKGDHRIAMSVAIAALRAENGIEIENWECADVSFPGFFNTLNKVSVR